MLGVCLSANEVTLIIVTPSLSLWANNFNITSLREMCNSSMKKKQILAYRVDSYHRFTYPSVCN